MAGLAMAGDVTELGVFVCVRVFFCVKFGGAPAACTVNTDRSTLLFLYVNEIDWGRRGGGGVYSV